MLVGLEGVEHISTEATERGRRILSSAKALRWQPQWKHHTIGKQRNYDAGKLRQKQAVQCRRAEKEQINHRTIVIFEKGGEEESRSHYRA
jgi:hypothetical protein